MNCLVLGMQWGDEGKGKAIDYLACRFDVVVRYQGGHNAGHTVYRDEEKVVLHLLPSGVFSPTTLSVIGNGVVISPPHLAQEIRETTQHGLKVENLAVSRSAPMILPFHQQLDSVFEESRHTRIGTTRRGIGPAYEDLIGRRAVLMKDLLDRATFLQRITPLNDYYNRLITSYGGREVRIEEYLEEYLAAGEFLRPYLTDTSALLHRCNKEGKAILFEGAQGALLDIHLGTYPFVTSSNPTVAGALCGTGLSHKAIHKVVGISKAYTTRVGEGPFPSELFGEEGETLRRVGNEYGATTGRPRRVGWLDLVALKYAIRINGTDSLFITKLDVLDDFTEIRVATAYEIDGKTTDVFEPHFDFLDRVRPVYQTLPGWLAPTTQARAYEELPAATRDYLRFIEEYTETPVEFISNGTLRRQTIQRRFS